MSRTSPPPAWRLIAAASIGNALEWFDLVVYGFFAVTIAKLFFPAGNDTVSLLLTLGTFGVSFFMRPLGAVVLGVYADRAGRKAALTLSILLMMAGTLLIAVMPTYASIGVLAPVGIVLARMIQGFSAGGEFGSATAFLAEHGAHRRGFFSSWQASSQGLTTLLAAIFGAVLTSALTPGQMLSWGWRVPFFFGLLIGPVAFYIRRHIDETPEFLAAQTTQRPLADTFTHQKERLTLAIGAVVVGTVATYLILYMPTYAVKQLGIPASAAFSATIATGITQMIGAPIFGHWSDRIGRTGIMIGAATLFLLLAYPAFAVLAAHPRFGVLIGMQLFLGTIVSAYFGALPALLTELFPTQTRTTGMSLGYNIAATVFGGFAPFIVTWLIGATGSPLAPSFYLTAAAAASIVALLRARRLGLR
ncbi:Proline/betaine transporter [Ralstonia mannitolilytica]|nr:MFS transporter [Ralstonia mannitolilytica]ATG22273.1 MFS transporter [Ralstonia pickettii]ANA35091.1 membrane protein [Ralstonia mannitolilytica]CAJ0684421.1 Proline/betaine transporter [Ralstonia mannitolilytica]CAJ0736878.1 Proline/betaine transporter [Ralstonia mannitolilytica]CAJ0864186.1 Proline/betaine transporter [Ralstonia mannitolilytica]